MKIFIGMKVPREDEDLRRSANRLSAIIKSAGHLPFVATDEIAQRGLIDPNDFMPFVRKHLQDSDLVIILNHPELRGGLIEAGMAYAWDIPIWLCYRPSERLSSSMRGCAAETIEYVDLDDLDYKLSRRLSVQKINLPNGPDKTVTWIWLEQGQLKVEFYDFSETAQSMFGNDVAYTITINEMAKVISLSKQSEATFIQWMSENFTSYFDIKKWLEENEVDFSIERESWA